MHKHSNSQTLNISIKTYFPLIAVILLVVVSAYIVNYVFPKMSYMALFMGFFFLFFGVLKVITLSKFAESFAMYDPIAMKIKFWGYLYPFVELILAILFIFGKLLDLASIVTIVVLGITTIGVYKKLLQKEVVQCACIGTFFKLPLTKVTIIENTIMIVMASIMFIQF